MERVVIGIYLQTGTCYLAELSCGHTTTLQLNSQENGSKHHSDLIGKHCACQKCLSHIPSDIKLSL